MQLIADADQELYRVGQRIGVAGWCLAILGIVFVVMFVWQLGQLWRRK